MRHLTAALPLALLTSLMLACTGSPEDGTPTADAGPDVTVEPDVQPDVTEPKDDRFYLLSVEPAAGPTAGYTQVEIHGNALTDIVSVRFGESEALDQLAVTDELIVALTPPRPRGLVPITVVRTDGSRATLEAAFTYRDAVEVASVEPAEGHRLGGEPVTIRGRGFAPGASVLFGDRAAIGVEVVDDQTMLAITPPGKALGSVDVLVTSDDGSGRIRDGYRYFAAPEIEAVVPPSGPLHVETPVVILGEGFMPPLAVTIGGRPLGAVEVVSPERIEGLAPPGEVAGPADVAVSTAFGTAVAPDAYTWFTHHPDLLEVLAVYPDRGPTRGGTPVTITATGLKSAADTEVFFGQTKAQVVSVDPATNSLRVTAPKMSHPMRVRIEVRSGAATIERADAFTYYRAPQVHEIQPNSGPTEGGTEVTITGEGFQPGAAVRVGALPAVGVEVLDATTIRATTAAGSPGLVPVTVLQGGELDTLEDGFIYMGEPQLWAVSPPYGSVAGGTLVRLLGHGFAPGSEVFFGNARADNVQVLSGGELEARTPPGEAGLADVVVRLPSGKDLKRPRAFTYFDPASEPGVWGDPIDGNVNVTVVDSRTRQRVEGATVVLGPDSATPHRGYTDENGQITFGGADISGDQMITATKAEFGTGQIVGFSAENVAVAIEPVISCSQVSELVDCSPPPPMSASVDGKVQAPFKGVTIPWGDCSTEVGAPGQLCIGCDEDSDCGDGYACSEIPGQGSFCTQPCSVNSDCPSDFLCLPIPPEDQFQCVPSAGELRTYCDITNASVDSPDAIAWPGVLVGPDGTFDFPSRLGDFALYCWSGLYKDGVFKPQLLGVLRHVGAWEDGEVVEAEIKMNHPVKHEVEIVLDRPDIGPPPPQGQENVSVRTWLDLGADGVLEFPRIQTTGRGRIQARLVENLTGDLYDATYMMTAQVVNTFAPNASSVTWEHGIDDLRADTVWLHQGDGWAAAPGTKSTVRAIAAEGEEAIWAVGDEGQILRSFASGYWALNPSNTTRDLHAVHALPDGSAIAVGEAGVATHWDGVVWNVKDTGVETTLEGVWLSSATDAWAVGGPYVLRFDGGSWSVAFEAPQPLHTVAVDGDGAVWIAGDEGYVARSSATGFNALPTSTTAAIRALWPSADGSMYAVGGAGAALVHDGAGFRTLVTQTSRTLRDVWGRGDQLWAVGDHGTILRLEDDAWVVDGPPTAKSSLLAVGGIGDRVWAMGSHELVLGPMLAIPENVIPSQGGLLGNSMSWTVRPDAGAHFSVLTFGSMTGPCEACGMMFMVPFTEWFSAMDGDLTAIPFPDLSILSGKQGFAPGSKTVSLSRVLVEDAFDFDSATGDEFRGARWKSWASVETSVVK